MSHHVLTEHRRLEELIGAVAGAFAGASAGEDAWEAFGVLSEELHAHFEREDELYFPAIWALRPELKGRMEELGERHEWFRNQLRRISDHLAHGDLAGAKAIFESVEEAFDSHEQIEEELLARIDAELEA